METDNKVFSTKELMEVFNIKAIKQLGQNFLHDLNIVEKILLSAEIDESDFVIEVGPGLGVMTNFLAKKAKRVIGVEIDKKLMEVLSLLKQKHLNLEIINDDILKLDIKKDIIDKYGDNENSIKVVANLPYYITTPIIMQFLEADIDNLKSLTFLIQKEVADRILAKPSTKEYGSLTVAISYFAQAKRLFNLPPTVFYPRPNVDSTVIRLDIREEAPFELRSKEFFFKFIKAAFANRRKTLANSLSNYQDLDIKREDVYLALDEIGIDRMVRGEALNSLELASLSNIIFVNKLL